ncbi:MAG: type II toxin-antitoxin system VapC family toxin [Rhodospirillales bacterium]|nr:type II toxin-antitoxin system VapC family toxin [Rhodospirillales bacterium]
MIVVDTSAVMAVLLAEQDAWAFQLALSRQDEVRLSAMTDFETRLLAFSRGGARLVDRYEALFDTGAFAIEPFGKQESLAAFDAYRRFGKGNHPARLNLVDCAAYALAKNLNVPLLFKGDDFARTDIGRVV